MIPPPAKGTLVRLPSLRMRFDYIGPSPRTPAEFAGEPFPGNDKEFLEGGGVSREIAGQQEPTE